MSHGTSIYAPSAHSSLKEVNARYTSLATNKKMKLGLREHLKVSSNNVGSAGGGKSKNQHPFNNVIYMMKPVPQRQSDIGGGGAVSSGEPMDEEVEDEVDVDAMLRNFEQELYSLEDVYTNDADEEEDADEEREDFEEITSEDVYKIYMKRKN